MMVLIFYTRKKETIDYLLKNGTDINKKINME